jgi:hypothetical protein
MSISVFGFTLVRVKKLDGLRAEHDRLRAESRLQITTLTERLDRIVDQVAVVTSSARNRDAGDGTPPGPECPDDRGVAAPPPVVRELISLADGLVDLAGTGAPSGPEHGSAVLRWVDSRAQALFAACDVVRIEDRGFLDLQRHEVVAGRAAPGDDLIDQIADTVRPGYEWRGTLVRAQQVIAYVPASEVVELVPQPRQAERDEER